MLGSLKGAFVKAGQFASVRHDLVPQIAAEALSELQSHVPPLPFETIRERIEEELGAPLDSLFEDFEREPLGAASVAQVHRARLPSGEIVAVKVQYPWVRASVPADLAMLGLGLRVASWWTGREIPDRDTLLDEFHRGLVEELDFEREASVAEEIAHNLADDPQIAVPRIYSSHSTARVLTMSACDTIPLDSRAGLESRGISAASVLEVVGRAYAKQIFGDGLFHADPHPGNLFVVDEPEATTRPRVLFVDFGLSKRLSPELRRDLRHGIYALLQSDLDGFLERMDSMGMIAHGAHAAVRPAVAAMFERIQASGGALAVPGQAILGLKDEAKELLRNTPGLQLPNDLLLYARTLTYLFALGEQLAPEVDLVALSTPHLLEFLAGRD
ncbi:MAG: AarF/UbiB family protein [Myxococcota bacterium]|nr:AarF/UbiB family protein [Myxococcota bacterium]